MKNILYAIYINTLVLTLNLSANQKLDWLDATFLLGAAIYAVIGFHKKDSLKP